MTESKLSNEYDNLVKYLEKHLPKKETPEIAQENRKQVVSKSIKKIIEECQSEIHSDTPFSKHITSSEGFDTESFESLMRVKLVDEHKRMQSYERPYISVTELCSCIRKNYYVRLKYPVDIKKQYSFSYLYLINKVGNVVHEVIQDLYSFTETEKTIVSEKFKVKGRLDGLKGKFIIEIKTIDVEKFKGKYIREHYEQGLIYAYILNTEYNYNIENITIVYVLRNLKRIIPFDLPLDNKIAESYLKRALILQRGISSKIVPDPLGASSEQCNFCSYKKYCKEDKTTYPLPFMKKNKKKEKTEIKDDKKGVFLL